ncbi:23S rRNA (uracil(1939)-C(5))-methyltransferase RlmD [Granulicatella sp. zg-84]|uniref:23S rRNA (uracil(1939)-C(5))-methyltransferase RlmD n=1 Tax=Granulicatella sp. zg-84 TaxID=2678503 RepID=UPI0013C1AEC4|nr:23S rRNA (uracil(1939)-C(5))-methyltransferase RlmD [Granulicatella sp. zg-84]NEW65878.1 23S rRNA (uracil(1939)-C(5))-methyltransferase RlmD [Granulicatella sp. zg-84]
MNKIEKNQVYTVICQDLTHEGMGVCKIDGYPIFVDNLLPEEEAIIKVIKVNKAYGIGKLVELKKEAIYRVPILDKKGTWTGTMPLQHMAYEHQLLFKQKQVKNVMYKIAKMSDIDVRQTIGAIHTTKYRNKAQIPVRNINGVLTTGFFRKNSHEFVPMEDFVIQDQRIDDIILIVRNCLREHSIRAYDEQAHKGIVRHIMIRRGIHTGEVQVVLITNGKKGVTNELVADIVDRAPDVKSIVQNINTKRTNVIMGNEQKIWYGKDFILDTLLDKTFAISSKSFYQVNPEQTEKLYQEAIKAAHLTQEDCVIDAYCGIGTIGICLADKVKHVYAMEIVEDAIVMAKQNALANHVHNMTFEVGSAETVLSKWVKMWERVDSGDNMVGERETNNGGTVVHRESLDDKSRLNGEGGLENRGRLIGREEMENEGKLNSGGGSEIKSELNDGGEIDNESRVNDGEGIDNESRVNDGGEIENTGMIILGEVTQIKQSALRPTVLIVDPPRKGLDSSFIHTSAKLNLSRIVYVSCNPATMARDVALYGEYGYVVQYVQPVDMFPGTSHVECVALLVKS